MKGNTHKSFLFVILVVSANLMLIGAAVLAVLALAACAVPPPAATSTPTKTAEPVATVAQPPVTGDDWSRVQEAGVIEVASPLDNQPFNMYDEYLKPDGFDVALMNELARRLNLRVEYVDVPFEGLLGALQLGQADAAIGAMAVTRDRQASVDFSQTYYVGEDGILAATDSNISAVQTKADVVNRRVGVVRGTVYEWWLNENLIKTGEMPAVNLNVYTRPDDAVRELGEGHIDLVVLDREPALTYAAQGLAKLVGKSQYSQNFAIPMRKGSTMLPHLNRALTAALADGTVAGLIEQYLNIDKDQQLPIPTPTPQPAEGPTATPIPAGTPTAVPCTNGTGYGQPLDLNFPDGTIVQPGKQFTKGWRIVNVGTCGWTTAYSFVYANKGTGGRMGGKDALITAPVPIGSSYDVSVPMVAPNAPGTYSSYWQMKDAKGVPFGKQVYVQIKVPAPATAVPAPTKTPPPGISFWVDSDHLKAGQSTWIHWDVQGVQSVFYREEGQPERSVTGKEDHEVRPSKSTSYYLRVVYYGGGDHTEERRITVEQSQKPPVITQFGTNPEFEAVTGQPVMLWWEVQGATDEVKLLRNGTQLYKGNAVQSSFTDNQPPAGTWTYELQARGPGGSAEPARRQITVKQEPPPQPPADITQFDYSPPGPVLQGDCVNLTWNVQGAVDGVELKVNGNPLPVDAGSRSYQDCGCPQNTGVCTYELRAWNGSGGDNAGLSVEVIMKTVPGNPAEQFCVDNGGQYIADSGICLFEDNMQCDAWAMYRGECPIGGVKVTGD